HVITQQLHDQTQLPFAKQRLDRAHDPVVAADRDPLADLERLLATEVPGRDHLLAAPELVAIVRQSTRTPSKATFGTRADLTGRQSGSLDGEEEATADDVAV